MNAAGQSNTAPNESDFTITERLNLNMASYWEYFCLYKAQKAALRQKLVTQESEEQQFP